MFWFELSSCAKGSSSELRYSRYEVILRTNRRRSKAATRKRREQEANEPRVMGHELVGCRSFVRGDGEAAEDEVDGEFRDLIGIGERREFSSSDPGKGKAKEEEVSRRSRRRVAS